MQRLRLLSLWRETPKGLVLLRGGLQRKGLRRIGGRRVRSRGNESRRAAAERASATTRERKEGMGLGGIDGRRRIRSNKKRRILRHWSITGCCNLFCRCGQAKNASSRSLGAAVANGRAGMGSVELANGVVLETVGLVEKARIEGWRSQNRG